jgi:RHS repeat-associated protein
VVVRDNMKVGNFSVSFVDLEVPLAGMPIRVTRTYDSRDSGESSDFGFGWRLDVSNVTVSEGGAAGVGWYGTSTGGPFPTYCVQATSTHPVTITFPDGKAYEFDPVLSPQCQSFVPVQSAAVTYVARPGTLGTLAPMGGGLVTVASEWPGDALLIDGFGRPFDPSGYQLSLPDGRVFVIDGQQGLQSLTDTNGNQLFFGPGGITHSSGKGIAFARDTSGRITTVTDPSGATMSYAYDADGNLEAYTDREENRSAFGYDATFPHYLSSIQDPLGRTPITNTYYPDGRIESHQDAKGNVIHYDHDVTGRQEIVTDRLLNQRVLTYDERGNVIHETDQTGASTARTFDERNNMLSETNALDQTTVYTYDAFNNRTSVEDPVHNVTSYTYGSLQKPTLITDPRSNKTTNTYDAAGNLLATQDALDNATSYTYDSRGNPLTQTVTLAGRAQVTQYEYDSVGNLTKETDALGHETSYTYDASGNRLTQTTTRTTNGTTETLTTTYLYDKNGRLVQTTDPDGSTTSTTFDPLGHQVATVDKLSRTTSYAYDEMGRLLSTTYPDATSESLTYDAEGRRLTSTDRGGRTTSYGYDAVGRLLTTTYADTTRVRNAYDEVGRLKTTWDSQDHPTQYTYDAAGRRDSVTDALGNKTTFGYDANGNQISVTDARGTTTTFVYDELNRRVKTVFPDAGSSVTFTQTGYDELGRRVSETDQAGLATLFGYDALGRLVSVKDPNNQTTSYGYDEIGNRIRQIDANGHVTSFGYDRLGRETSRTLPDNATETKSYDAAGNLLTRTDFAGRTTSYAYDLANRLASRSYPDGSSVSFSYTATGRRQSVTDAHGTTSYTYDLRDQLTSLVYPDTSKLSYFYGAFGNRSHLKLDVGGARYTSTYGYDADNRLESLSDPFGGNYSLTYDPNGNRDSLTYPNGTTTSYSYDVLNRLSGLETTGPFGRVQSYAYTLGPSGNRTQILEADGTVKQYGYDRLYRLTGESVAGPAVAYTASFSYDSVGNRQTQVRTGTAAVANSYSYDARDRMLSDGLASYAYDADGNLVSKSGEATYAWDFENRLVRVQKADGTLVQHVYDADGNRVRTTTTLPGQPPVAVDYLVDTSGSLSQVVAESVAGALTAYYVRADDLVSITRGSGTRFYHADGLGSIRALTDETGQVTDTYQYSAFGELLAHTGTDTQPYAFTGEPLDPNVGWQYHRARWMDTTAGRFVGMDPVASNALQPLTLLRYGYAAANPTNVSDPTGRIPQSLIPAFVGSAVHSYIGDDFVEEAPGRARFANYYSIRTILATDNPLPILCWPYSYWCDLRPDLVDATSAVGAMGPDPRGWEVYEIKPKGVLGEGVLLAGATLAVELTALNASDPQHRSWRPGSFYRAPKLFVVNVGTGPWLVETEQPAPGIIVYQAENFLELAAAVAIIAVMSMRIQGAEIEEDASIATLPGMAIAPVVF